MFDIEDLARKGQAMLTKKIARPTLEQAKTCLNLITEILKAPQKINALDLNRLKKQFNAAFSNAFIFNAYELLVAHDLVTPDTTGYLRQTLMVKKCKSHSGITSITLIMGPYPSYTNADDEQVVQSFSCKYDCSFCPNQEGQPRSYLLNEPAMIRANRNNFDAIAQMHDRMDGLYKIGHDSLGKLEVLFLGGTFSNYPKEYVVEFTRDMYYAANTYWTRDSPRPRLSLEEEIDINSTARCRVIGLTIETRPDTITPTEIRFFRKIGCTRVQLGIQHLHADVLEYNNRRCSPEKTRQGIRLLKENCYKIDGHFMPKLPGSTYEKDRQMLVDEFLGLKGQIVPTRFVTNKNVHWEHWNLHNPDDQVDQVKLYPTSITPYTKIQQWFDEGKYVPYPEEQFIDLMLDFKEKVFPWIRINRIVRDFYQEAVIVGSNLGARDDLHRKMQKSGTWCQCIRCREVKDKEWDGTYKIVVRQYGASGGQEFFISAEFDRTLYGFVRLRLDHATNKVFKELEGAALIREAHVYSQLTNVGAPGTNVQHRGIGTKLMHTAESLARDCRYRKVAVISGIGSRTFYEKLGYELEEGDGEFMTKLIKPN